MPKNNGLNRRAFLKSASMTALAGAVGTGGGNHMRMNLGSPRPLIEKALNNMTTALKKV